MISYDLSQSLWNASYGTMVSWVFYYSENCNAQALNSVLINSFSVILMWSLVLYENHFLMVGSVFGIANAQHSILRPIQGE